MCAASAAPTTSPRPVTTLKTPGRDTGLERQLGQADGRQRRRGRRLEDDRIPGGERRPDLPDRHPQRVVPRADLADDADRLAPDEARVRAGVLVGGLAFEVADLGREEAQVVAGEREVRIAAELVGRPGLERLEAGQVVRVAVEQIAQPVHDRDPLGRAHARPATVAEDAPGGGDGAIDIGHRPVRDPPDQLPVAGLRTSSQRPLCGRRSRRRR